MFRPELLAQKKDFGNLKTIFKNDRLWQTYES